MFNRMLILCSAVVGVLVIFASSAGGDVAVFRGHMHQNNHHTLNHQIHRSIHVNNNTQDKILYLNETADLKSYETVADVLQDRDGHPTSKISSIVTECLLQLSFSCAQKKLLLFLHELDGKESIELVGNSLSIVRIGEVYSSLVKESGFEDRLNNIQDQGVLWHLVDQSVGSYLDSHVIRVSLPSWIRADVEGYAEATNALEFGLRNIPADEDSEETNALNFGLGNSTADEGRGKKNRGHHGGHGGGHHGGGKKGDKGGKKMLMAMKKMMGLMMMGKFGMMVPMMLGSAKLMAAKGMLVGMTSLLMSIIVKVMGLMGSGKKVSGGGKIKMGGGPYPPSGGCGGCGGVSNAYGPPSGGGCGGRGGFGGCSGGSITIPSNSYGAPFSGSDSGFTGAVSDTYGARGGTVGGASSDSYGAPSDSGVVTGHVYDAPNWYKSSSVNRHEASFQPHNNTEGQ